ncbi:TPA: iron-regulated protein, partial [Serratia marcescens]
VGVPLHVRDLQPAAAPTVLMLAEPGVQVDANTADYLWITPSVK